MKKLSVLFTALIISFTAKSQMTVTNAAPYNNPTYMVNDVLSGQGVSASNITFTGDANQLGFFNGVISNIGLDSGLVISTGNVNDIPAGGALSTDFNNTTGDPDLLTIAKSVTSNPQAGNITSTGDVATLEFDFAVVGDTVEFRFVFASDEYTQWINSVYNDIFSFFLSGPGISGPYNAPAGFPNGAVNVAVVPGTQTPITISSIHPSLNQQYYIGTPTGHSFNGFTTVLTAKYPVQCGGTYHFKFAIADCQDRTLDTGVLIEANSLTSSGVGISAVTPFPNNTLVEGCGSGEVYIIRSDTSKNDTINLDITGNATSSDYNAPGLQSTVVFPTGADTITINIDALIDSQVEGVDTLYIQILGNTGCNMVTLLIEDYQPMEITSITDSINICTPAQTGEIEVAIKGGRGPFGYWWDNGAPSGATSYVKPEETTNYSVVVSDMCGNTVEGGPVQVWVQCKLEVANVFTPNGDGRNDFFRIINLDDYQKPSVKVMNRWGQVVYESEQYENDWDGKHMNTGDPLPEGVYFYIVSPNNVKYDYENDSKKEELKYTVNGSVQLFR